MQPFRLNRSSTNYAQRTARANGHWVKQTWLPPSRPKIKVLGLLASIGLGALTACDSAPPTVSNGGTSQSVSQGSGMEVKLLVGSALGHFCDEAIAPFNQSNPTLADGSRFYATCEALGSGDVVDRTLTLAEQFQAGQLPAEDPSFPTLLSVDGEIYHSQMIYRMEQLFPGQSYLPDITDAPLLAVQSDGLYGGGGDCRRLGK